MNNRQSNFFEHWVRQEQIAYWLISLALIAMSVAAFLLFQPNEQNLIETNLGAIEIEEAASISFFTYVLFAMPALSGLFILYWTSNRDNVRALTSGVLRQQANRWLGFGLVFLVFGGLQLFGEGNVLQKTVIAPSLLVFGLFMLFRGVKLAGFRALGG